MKCNPVSATAAMQGVVLDALVHFIILIAECWFLDAHVHFMILITTFVLSLSLSLSSPCIRETSKRCHDHQCITLFVISSNISFIMIWDANKVQFSSVQIIRLMRILLNQCSVDIVHKF